MFEGKCRDCGEPAEIMVRAYRFEEPLLPPDPFCHRCASVLFARWYDGNGPFSLRVVEWAQP